MIVIINLLARLKKTHIVKENFILHKKVNRLYKINKSMDFRLYKIWKKFPHTNKGINNYIW